MRRFFVKTLCREFGIIVLLAAVSTSVSAQERLDPSRLSAYRIKRFNAEQPALDCGASVLRNCLGDGAVVPGLPSSRSTRRQPSSAERGVYLTAVMYQSAGFTYDLATTIPVIRRGGHEMNPFAPARNVPGLVAVSLGAETAHLLGNYFLLYKRGHPRWASLLLFSIGSVEIGLGNRNHGVCRPACR